MTPTLALLVAASVVTAPAPPTSSWDPCAENAAVDCTAVTVPVDWDARNGETISIAVARRAAPDPRGVLIYLPAGPGSSGVDAVTDDQQFALLFPPEVAEHFDVVGFDPRGVRRSNPVRCDAELVATLDLPAPTTASEYDALLAAQAAVGADCRQRTGPVFDHLDSTQSARDVDAIRAALGVDQVNLYGLSYGTVIGQMYAEQFGNRLRTLTLDAVYDHSVGSTRFDVTAAHAAQGAFDQFVAWCAATPTCELHGQDVRRLVAGLYETTTDPAALSNQIVSPLTRPDFAATAHQIAVLAGTTPTATPPAPSTEVPLPIYTLCADTRVTATTFAQRQTLAATQHRVAPDVRRAAFGIPTLCVNPPFPATNPQHRLHAPDAPPALVMNARYDPATPHQGARRVADQLPGAKLVTHAGLGHGVANRTACTRAIFTSYLLDRVLPAHDTICR